MAYNMPDHRYGQTNPFQRAADGYGQGYANQQQRRPYQGLGEAIVGAIGRGIGMPPPFPATSGTAVDQSLPVAPTFSPEELAAFGLPDDPETQARFQEFLGGLNEKLWAPMQLQAAQTGEMNVQARQRFAEWETMMQQAFTHAFEALSGIPGISARGNYQGGQ